MNISIVDFNGIDAEAFKHADNVRQTITADLVGHLAHCQEEIVRQSACERLGVDWVSLKDLMLQLTAVRVEAAKRTVVLLDGQALVEFNDPKIGVGKDGMNERLSYTQEFRRYRKS